MLRSTLTRAACSSAVTILSSCLTSCDSLTQIDAAITDEPELALSATREDGAVPIIFDTDYGFDVDDVGALALLNALANGGEARLVAATTTVTDTYALGAMDAVNTYYGRPDVPLGQNVSAPASYRWDKAYPYWRTPDPHFIADLDRDFPHDTGTRVPAVSLYRQTLASAPDGSVKVVAVGFMKNLADLLASGPDDYSDLSGEDLVRAKVGELIVMGGGYPSNQGDFNLTSGPGKNAFDAKRVIETWPGEIVFTPGNVCGGVVTGQTLTGSEVNPVARAYELFFGRQGQGRASWDLCAVLYAVRGLQAADGETYFAVATDQRLSLREDGYNEWVTPADPRHKRLTRVMPTARMEEVLNTLLTQTP